MCAHVPGLPSPNPQYQHLKQRLFLGLKRLQPAHSHVSQPLLAHLRHRKLTECSQTFARKHYLRFSGIPNANCRTKTYDSTSHSWRHSGGRCLAPDAKSLHEKGVLASVSILTRSMGLLRALEGAHTTYSWQKTQAGKPRNENVQLSEQLLQPRTWLFTSRRRART